MKIYYCKECGKKGIRPTIRKHIYKEHIIDSKTYNQLKSINEGESPVSKRMISIEI